jgi:hypothetical protein
MRRTASRPRSGAGAARSRPPSIRRLLVTDALRSWVPPTAAVAVLAVTMLLDALELVPDGVAAVIAVVAFLVLGAFIVIAPLLADEHDGRVPPAVAVAGGMVAIVVLAYPFAVRLFPGAPLRQLPLTTAAKGALVATADQGSRVDVVVDAHLPLASDRRDRAVHYDVDLVDDGGVHEQLSGELGDSWRMRRLGRRGTAPSHFEHLSAMHVVDVGSGALHVADVTLTGDRGATAIATVYRDRTPPVAFLYAGAVLAVFGALVLDLWWDPSAGSTATMVTASACTAAIVFVAAGAGHPGIRDVIGAALVGAVVGVPAGTTAAWLGRVLAPSGRTRRRA